MKWKATAGLLVDDGRAEYTFEASSAAEADAKAAIWAYDSKVLDSGDYEVEPLEEDKQLICTQLLDVLQMTRGLYDVEDLEYSADSTGTETVTALFRGGYTKTANVTMDSGIAMIKDILRQIV